MRNLPIIADLRRSHGLQRGMLIAGLILVGILVLTAIFAPLIAPFEWGQQSGKLGHFGTQQPPNSVNIWGTTVSGFDVFSRVVWGTRTALAVIFFSVIASSVLGVILGLFSGYLGGWVDRILVMIADAIYAFPSLLLAIVLSIVISGGQSSAIGGILAAALSITVVFVPQYFRVIRAEAVRLRRAPFVESSQVIGVSALKIMFGHVLRNSTRTLPLIFTLNCSEAILTLAGLGFIGFGIEPTAAAEWGYDLNRARADVTSGIWWTSIFPGLAIVLAVLGITLVGESLNDLNDPRLRTRKGVTKGRRDTKASHAVEMKPGRRLDVTNLSVDFATDAGDVSAVRDLSLYLEKGEIMALVGESGSGKTVTARSILGLLPETARTSGVIAVEGTDVVGLHGKELNRIRGELVSMVFQEPSGSLNPVYPIWWQIGEGLRAHNRRITTKQIKAEAIRALTTVGIPDAEKRINYYPHEFSGGQKQRIMIAMALAMGAEMIIADEPTTALDVTVQAEILDLLRGIRDEYNTSILIITHNMGVVADIADTVAVMYHGEIVERADVEDLFYHPREPYTQQLLAAVPHLGRNSASAQLSQADLDALDSHEVIVEARGLEITYPGRLGAPDFTAVKGVDFTIHAGEVYGLVGESGSGKTTIGRSIVGLETVTGGSLRVLGHEMNRKKESEFWVSRKDIGFVFQDPATSFDPQQSIGAAIAEPMVIHAHEMSEADRKRRVAELLEAVQLPAEFAERFPHELSGGQRQRVSFARALALQPKLLIADEPTSALDVSVQAKVLELFRDLHREFGFACLFITHDLAVVDMLAQRIGVLYKGELIEQGRGADVLGHPEHTYTQRLIASLPVPDPREQAQRRVEQHRLVGI